MNSDDIKDSSSTSTSNSLSFDITKRLSFVRYMNTQATQVYSNQPEPISSISILLFYDCIELFLQIVCDYKNVNVKSPPISEYFSELEKKGNISLTEKENVKRLSQIRSSFKHKGQLISKSEIDWAKVIVFSFLEQNTLSIFGKNFSDLSLIDYIKYNPAKKYLKDAEVDILEENYHKVSSDLSMAFDVLINDYINEKLGEKYFVEYGAYSIFSKKINQDPYFMAFQNLTNLSQNSNPLTQFANELEKQIDAIRETLKINTLNIDYRKFIKFRKLVPPPYRTVNGKSYFSLPEKMSTKDDYLFCIDFVIESAMRIQELDL